MATTKIRVAELAFKHLTDDLTEEESIEISQLLQDPANQKLFDELTDHNRIEAEVKGMQRAEAYAPNSWRHIEAAYRLNNSNTEAAYPFHHKRIAWKPWLAAAAVLVPLAVGVTWYFLQQQSPAPATATVTPAPAKTQYASNEPKSEKALWKRAAGLAVSLDELKNGVEYSSGVPVTKNDSGLVYSPARRNDIPLPDTVQTLKGGYYRLQLPDGSKVVLNSASSVFFAPVFGGNDRQVSVNGEAWFEVVKDARPFYVHVSGMKIQVYGTRFNVQAYPNEDVKTSLVEGSVKVTAGKQKLSLKPGEQAVLKKKKLQKVTDPVAIEKATAWKTGMFIFKNDDIKTIMGQLSRNYDLEVEYRGTVPEKTLYGVFYHNDPVDLILKHLQDYSGIRFKIEGKKIIVDP